MSQQLYKVIFKGEISDDVTIKDAKKNLSENLGLSIEKIEKLFCEKPIVLKDKVNYTTGTKVQNLFDISGAICHLIKSKERKKPVQTVKTTPRPKKIKEVKEPLIFFCPNCKLAQNPGVECIQCGIIFDKFKIKKDNEEEQTRLKKIEKEERRGPASDLELENAYPLDYSKSFDIKTETIRRKEFGVLARRILSIILPSIKNCNQISQAIVQVVVNFILMLVGYMAIFYSLDTLWIFYTSTPVGEFYANKMLQESHFFYEILGLDIVHVAVSTSIISLIACLSLAAVCRVLGFSRYLYFYRGVIGKLILLAAPLIMLSAYYIQQYCEFKNFETAIATAFLPVLCLFAKVFALCEHILPIIFDVVKHTVQLISTLINAPVEWLQKGMSKIQFSVFNKDEIEEVVLQATEEERV
jgi:hypothetical protein